MRDIQKHLIAYHNVLNSVVVAVYFSGMPKFSDRVRLCIYTDVAETYCITSAYPSLTCPSLSTLYRAIHYFKISRISHESMWRVIGPCKTGLQMPCILALRLGKALTQYLRDGHRHTLTLPGTQNRPMWRPEFMQGCIPKLLCAWA